MPGEISDELLAEGCQPQALSPSSSLDLESLKPQPQLEEKADHSATVETEGSRTRIDARLVADSILGLSDGLTVPFALTAGLTEFGSTRIVILGGLAELIAGSISMGLGGYVGAKSEGESYDATSRICSDLIGRRPQEARRIIQDYFRKFDVEQTNRIAICERLMGSPEDAKAFLMKHHFDATEPATRRPYMSALALAVSYFVGGFLPLIPYFLVSKTQVLHGLFWSIGLMVIVLFVFGYAKTCVVRGWRGRHNTLAGLKGALQMLVVGALAAGAAVGLVRLVNIHHDGRSGFAK